VRGGLDRLDLAADFLGRAAGLAGQRLDLRGDDGKALALTSEATTAKPLPASPARAASIVAFSASRLVWLAMPLMIATTASIFCAESASPCTCWSVLWAASTALPAMDVERVTCRAISLAEEAISSVAAAIVCTLAEACSAAMETALACWVV
jgi:hypothetical protein